MAWNNKPKPVTLSGLMKQSAAQRRPTKSTSYTKGGVARLREGYGAPKDWYALRAEVIERDGGKCVQCGSTEHLHAHHMRRESRGGATTALNLLTLCELCHQQRHAHMHKHRR